MKAEYELLTYEQKLEYLEKIKYYYYECKIAEKNLSKYIGCTRNTVHKIIDEFGIRKTKEQVDADKLYKFEHTCLEKFGAPSPLQSEFIKDKISATNLQRYGSASPLKNKSVREKAENTVLKRYGVSNSMKSEIVKEKSRQTCRKHYGVDYYVQTQESQDHINKVLKEKYGVNSIAQLCKSRDLVEILNDKEKFQNFLDAIPKKDMRKQEICELLDIGIVQFNARLRKWDLNNYVFRRNSSKYELEISNILDGWQVEHIRNYRKLIINPDTNVPLELDIYIPSVKLAIEFNGIAWHDKNNPIRENKKTQLCAEKGVKLIHIWEDDWNNDKDKFIKYMHDEIFNYVPITKIECVDVEKQPVYDIEVPKFNNFTLSNGLVVHNSVDMRQSLKLAGFENVDLVSLDRSPDGYITYKYAINEQRIAHLNIPELEFEIVNLARDNQTGKIDHDADKCFTGDTKVKLVDGRDLSILELMEEQEYKTNWVYTINESTHKIEPKPIKKVFQTMITEDLVKVTLDNGESVTCTPNHRFMLRDGTYTQANKLSAGTSLMPIYTKVSDSKVASIEFIKSLCNVYDLEIEDNHNFGLACGVFVHNSKDEADGICGAVYNAYLHAQDLNLYLSDSYDITLDVNEETFVDSDKDNILQNLVSTTLPYENKTVTYTPSMLENIIDNSSNNDDGFFFL